MRELVIDSFAGGGGASLGIEQAIGRPVDIAINHDPEAVAMHIANHPATKHYTQDVYRLQPLQVTKGRPVALLWASPDCRHHSRAKGGKPVSKQVRDLAAALIPWARDAQPRVIMLENVPEFRDWGPLDEHDMPIKSRKSEHFDAWCAALRECGYELEWRLLRACDYGAPTSRRRLFIIARRDGAPIVWPEPTHGPGLLPYRTAAECIDWSLPCPSIFLTKEQGRARGVNRPLVPATMKRIAAGTKRYVLDAERPFIVNLTHGIRLESIDEPWTTITGAHRGEKALVMPHLVGITHNQSGGMVDAIDAPVRTITTSKGGELALVAPTLIQTGYGERPGQAPRVPGLDKPMGTVVAAGSKHALVTAFLAKHFGDQGQRPGLPLDEPVSTVTAVDHHALVASNLIKLYGTSTGAPVDGPMPTVTGGGQHIAEVRAFLSAYYGNDKDGQALNDPMRTVTSKERFGLVMVEGWPYQIVDIGMRMLTPRELFRAQGFPEGYVIDPMVGPKRLTKTSQIRMCGNSVCPPIARALVEANVAGAGQQHIWRGYELAAAGGAS